ncbi:hypothetical protein AB4Y44_10215 [Paraburkholderia sp. BR10937]|uniref:hypothetical protein n=1 Tax=Paraburkholderia sp. BR10937 TaxID=3236994 RepID=UPI0034D1B67B
MTKPSGQVPALPPFPGLTGGLIRADQNSAAGGIAGQLRVHGQVRNDGEVMRYDDAMPNGFHVIALDADPDRYLDEAARKVLARIGAQTIGVTHDESRVVAGRVLLDTSGKYEAFFNEHGAKALIVRPDSYVFGAVGSLTELSGLVRMLGAGLALQAANGIGQERLESAQA